MAETHPPPNLDRPSLGTLIAISVFWIPLSVIGDGFTALLVPLRVAELADQTLVATTVGLVSFAGLLGAMLVQPIAGAVSDALRPRVGRRVMLVLGAGLTMVALAVFGSVDGLLAMATAFVLVAVAASVAQAAYQALLPDLVAVRWRGRAAGFKGLADVGGAFVGFLLLGWLLTNTDARVAVVAVGALVAAVALLAALLVREHPVAWQAPSAESNPSVTGGVGALAPLLVTRFLFLLATFTVGRYLVLFVADRLDLPATAAAATSAMIFAVLTLVTALSSLPAGWLVDRLGRRALMVGGAILGAVGGALLVTATTFPAVLAAGALMALGSAAFGSASWALAADLAEGQRAGMRMAVINLSTTGAAAVAGLFGFVGDISRGLVPAIGYGAIFAVAAGLFAASATTAWSVGRTKPGQPAVPGGGKAAPAFGADGSP